MGDTLIDEFENSNNDINFLLGIKTPANIPNTSARTEVNIFTGEVVTSVTFSRGNLEFVGVNAGTDGENISTGQKFGGIKFDGFYPKKDAGILIGGSYTPLDGTAGLRIGIGTSDNNVYIEVEGNLYQIADSTLNQIITQGDDLGYLDAGVYNNGRGQHPGYWSDTGFIDAPDGELADVISNSQSLSEFISTFVGLHSGNRDVVDHFLEDVGIENCFLAGTMIDMWPEDVKPNVNGLYDEKEVLAKVWKKPIEQITADDDVLSYDKDGNLKPGKVTRTFQNKAKHILDFHGLMMTPGHATFCAEGKFKDQHVPIIDILRSDGCIQKSDGTIIRAATNCPINSAGDRFIWAVTGETKDGVTKVADKGKIRLGTRYITPEGNDVSVLDMIMSNDVVITEEGLIKHNANDPQGMPFRWAFSDKLPKPEAYVMQRSQLTTQDIYQHGEWEMAFPPQMPAPFAGEAGGSYKPNPVLQASAPPNIPLSMENSPNKPTVSRKQRRAMEAKKRKANKQGRVTIH